MKKLLTSWILVTFVTIPAMGQNEAPVPTMEYRDKQVRALGFTRPERPPLPSPQGIPLASPWAIPFPGVTRAPEMERSARQLPVEEVAERVDDLNMEAALLVAKPFLGENGRGPKLLKSRADNRRFWQWDFEERGEFGTVAIDAVTGKLIQFVRIRNSDATSTATECEGFSSAMAIDLAQHFLAEANLDETVSGEPACLMDVIARWESGSRRIANVVWRKAIDGVPVFDAFTIVTVDSVGPRVIGFSDASELTLTAHAPTLSASDAIKTVKESGHFVKAEDLGTEAALFALSPRSQPRARANDGAAALVWVVGNNLGTGIVPMGDVSVVDAVTGSIISQRIEKR